MRPACGPVGRSSRAGGAHGLLDSTGSADLADLIGSADLTDVTSSAGWAHGVRVAVQAAPTADVPEKLRKRFPSHDTRYGVIHLTSSADMTDLTSTPPVCRFTMPPRLDRFDQFDQPDRFDQSD